MKAGRIALIVALPLAPLHAQATISQIQSGQELIYRGSFGAARFYFSDLSRQFPRDPVGPALEASALVWWGDATLDTRFGYAVIDSLLDEALARAAALSTAPEGGARFNGFFWLGVVHGYRARHEDIGGSVAAAAREAKAMLKAFQQALMLDSACADCLSGLGVLDYEVARAGFLARMASRVIGLGGGNAERGLARMRRASEEGSLMRVEARWVYANALLREGEQDAAQREEGLRRMASLSTQFPDNAVFRRVAPTVPASR